MKEVLLFIPLLLTAARLVLGFAQSEGRPFQIGKRKRRPLQAVERNRRPRHILESKGQVPGYAAAEREKEILFDLMRLFVARRILPRRGMGGDGRDSDAQQAHARNATHSHAPKPGTARRKTAKAA